METDELAPLILDLNLTCPFCAHRVAPEEIERLNPETIRCPACRHAFPKEPRRIA